MDIKNKIKFTPIKGEYDFIFEFHEGLAFVRNNADEFKIGYIDKTGEVVIPLIYYGRFGRDTFVHYPCFSEGLAPLINENRKFGYVDKTGKVVIPFEYDLTYTFRDGLAAVKKDNKWGWIDKSNNIVIPLEYDNAGSGIFYMGHCDVEKNGKWGQIDMKGSLVTPFILEESKVFVDHEVQYKNNNGSFAPDYIKVNNYSEGYVLVKANNKYGYIDEAENIVIPIEYDEATSFHEGLAAVKKGGIYNFIDHTGKAAILLDNNYEDVRSFQEGFASVKKDGKFGFIDKTGSIVVPLEYDYSGYFNEGLAVARKDSKWWILSIEEYLNKCNAYCRR